MKTSLFHSIRVNESFPLSALQHSLLLQASGLASQARPGQFLHIKIPGEGSDPLLRRPLSIAASFPARGEIQLIFRTAGKGTKILTRLAAGDTLDCLGPLGNSFTLPEAGAEAILVAGGIGIAPLWLLAQKLDEKAVPFSLLWGVTDSSYFFPLLNPMGTKPLLYKMATDDGSQGFAGPVTELAALHLLKAKVPVNLYACGPVPMLKKVQEMSLRFSSKLEVSLEEKMACGVGACLGCAVKVRRDENVHRWSYQRCCHDGPVFTGEELFWDDQP